MFAVDSPKTCMKRVVLSWSGGKDSAMALYELQRSGYAVDLLLTSVTSGYDRISMHGVRRELLEWQAAELGIPLQVMTIPPACSNADYEAALSAALAQVKAQGITCCAFGDIFLEDVRAYRERVLAGLGVEPLFPLWGRNTTELARSFIAAGFKAIVTCVDPKAVPLTLLGRYLDAEFLRELPPTADPCGERGEFHTFVVGGPLFRSTLRVKATTVVERNGFYFCELESEN